jgi:hypothetical protein
MKNHRYLPFFFKSIALSLAMGTSPLTATPESTSPAAYESPQDAPLVVLAKLVSYKKFWSHKLAELATGTNSVSDPTFELKPVLTNLERAVSLAREALMQNDNEALIAFKYADARAKIALARSAFSRSIAPLVASGQLGPQALARIEDIGTVLDEIYNLFLE